MPYAFLVGAILCECAGTYFMKLSDGFSQILPSAACLGLYAVCFFLLSKALQGIELSFAYAAWGAGGIVLATLISTLVFKEPLNVMMIVGIVLCIAGVVIMRLFAEGA